MKNKLLSLFLSYLILFMPYLAYANENIPKISHLKKGQKAPFEGSLLNKEASATILAEKESLENQCKLQKDYLLSKEKAKCDLLISNSKISLDILQEKYTSINKIKDEEIKRMMKLAVKKKSKNYDTLWFAGGFLAGTVVTILITFAINKASDNK